MNKGATMSVESLQGGNDVAAVVEETAENSNPVEEENNNTINQKFIKYENKLHKLRSEIEYFKDILKNKNHIMLMYNFITRFIMAIVGSALTFLAITRGV